MAKVIFVDSDPDAILADLLSKYESLTNRSLQPGQAEVLVLNAIAYRASLILTALNEAANQCLVANSSGIALENLGQLVGVVRLQATAAECMLQLNLVPGHGNLLIPAGIRVQSIDGQVVFLTEQDVTVNSVTNTAFVKARCSADGIVGNNYAIGQISVVLDPQAYLNSVSNTDASAGGVDTETDDELRQRIILAPAQFSVAGPTDAYKFFARKAHPLIVDVAVTIGHDVTSGDVIPGQVDIFPLLVDGQPLTDEITDAVLAQCNDEKVRPLTDTVVVKSPTEIDYALTVEVTLLTDADETSTVAAITANLQAYVDARKNKLGIDVVKSQIIGAAQIAGVYSINPTSPASDIVVNESSYTVCSAITVTVVGRADG